MPDEKQASTRPYTWEELLSFDRMKRAVMSRVVDRAEQVEKNGAPMTVDQLTDVIKQEWQKAKDTVRTSPAARQAARDYLQRMASNVIEELIQTDKDELEAMGIVEKTI